MTINKEKIENAITEINGVIMDFVEAADSLKNVKSLLNGMLDDIEKEADNERRRK